MQPNASRFDALIDVVDPTDRVVGTVLRKQALSTGVNFRVAHVFLFNTRGELLLQCIASGLRHPSMWGSSAAGYLNSGESYHSAAARKLKEELGLAAVLEPLGKTSMKDGASTKFIGLFKVVHDGPFSPDPQQVSQVAFESVSDVLTQRRLGQRAFTPTFLHLLDCYLNGSYLSGSSGP
jgi:isopentenyldiphosphate isomerase